MNTVHIDPGSQGLYSQGQLRGVLGKKTYSILSPVLQLNLMFETKKCTGRGDEKSCVFCSIVARNEGTWHGGKWQWRLVHWGGKFSEMGLDVLCSGKKFVRMT